MSNINLKKIVIVIFALHITVTTIMAFVLYNQKLDLDNVKHYLQHVALDKALQPE